MTDSVRFHVLLLPNLGWDALKARAVAVERLGFDAVALPDHLVDWTNPVAPWFEAWTALAAIAESTSTIRLTTMVTQIPLRNPAMLARQVLTLDHISHGRIELGLGTGLAIDPSYSMAGLPNWDAKERVERFGEYLELVDRLLSQEVTTFAGRFYEVDSAVMNPRPMQSPRPPLLVAALGPRMMRHAAKRADVWNSLSFLPSFDEQIDETRRRRDTIDAMCAEIGRNPESLRASYTLFDAGARHRGGAMEIYESVDRFTEQVERVIELGIDDIGLYYPTDPVQLPVFERIANDALPILRRRGAG